MTDEYLKAIEQAEKNLADAKERGADAIGGDWEEVRKEIFTEEEIAESDLRVAIIRELIKARRERGISQYQLAESSGVKQSSIARLERGGVNPTIDTLQKILAPLGKKLAIVPM
jgi:ribosome-binding protein aMBF1 (putative translation factor)